MVQTRSMSRKQDENKDKLLRDNLLTLATVFNDFSHTDWEQMAARANQMILDENRTYIERSLIQDALIEDALIQDALATED